MINLAQDVAEMFAACQAAPEMFEGYGVVGEVRDMQVSPGLLWLRARGEDFNDHGDRLAQASDDANSSKLEGNRRYRKTEAGREAMRRYDASPKGKASKAARRKRYEERKAQGKAGR